MLAAGAPGNRTWRAEPRCVGVPVNSEVTVKPLQWQEALYCKLVPVYTQPGQSTDRDRK